MNIDPRLLELAGSASRCLEIEAGSQTQSKALQLLFPELEIENVSVSPVFQRLNFDYATFDFVICRFSLWKCGSHSEDLIEEIFRVLKPGGSFYSCEFDSQFISFHPPRPAIQALIAVWNGTAQTQGFDPSIGKKIAGQMIRSGFKDLKSSFESELAHGSDPKRFMNLQNRLRSFYLNEEKRLLPFEKNHEVLVRAERDLHLMGPEDLIVDGSFLNIGMKPFEIASTECDQWVV